jgi:5-methylcytosine-specific restriction endonuclease McrA
LKRGKPLARTSGLKRTGPLERGDSQLARGERLRPGKRKSKAKIPEQVRARVMRRTAGKCVRPGCNEKAVHTHHLLDEQTWPAVARIEANLVGVCFRCHWDHHFAPDGRLPWEVIPQAAHRLAAELGPRAQRHLEIYYPKSPQGADQSDDSGFVEQRSPGVG